MASIWRDVDNAMNNIVVDNKRNVLRFQWQFVTFSNESQQEAQVRYRKAGVYGSIADRMNRPETLYSPVVHVWNQGYGDLLSNITAVEFPLNTFSEGTWFFQIRQWTVGATEWSGWTTYKVEISEYEHRVAKETASTAEVLGPHFEVESTYGMRVVVMNNAGATTTSNEQTFDVWDGDLFLHHDGLIQSVPTSREQSDGTIKRVAKS